MCYSDVVSGSGPVWKKRVSALDDHRGPDLSLLFCVPLLFL